MAQATILSFLILIVYQFDDVIRALHLIAMRIGNRQYKRLVLDSDRHVGTVMAIVALPLLLNYLLVSDKTLTVNLAIILAALVAFSLLMAGLDQFSKRMEFVRQREHINAVAGTIYALAGFFKPSIRLVPWVLEEERWRFFKISMLLSVPVLLGLIFRSYYGSMEGFDDYLDILVVVMIGGLFIHITIAALEHYFKTFPMSVLAYFRIALGLAVAFILIAQ